MSDETQLITINSELTETLPGNSYDIAQKSLCGRGIALVRAGQTQQLLTG